MKKSYTIPPDLAAPSVGPDEAPEIAGASSPLVP